MHALGRELLPVVTSSPFSSVKASSQLMDASFHNLFLIYVCLLKNAVANILYV